MMFVFGKNLSKNHSKLIFSCSCLIFLTHSLFPFLLPLKMRKSMLAKSGVCLLFICLLTWTNIFLFVVALTLLHTSTKLQLESWLFGIKKKRAGIEPSAAWSSQPERLDVGRSDHSAGSKVSALFRAYQLRRWGWLFTATTRQIPTLSFPF